MKYILIIISLALVSCKTNSQSNTADQNSQHTEKQSVDITDLDLNKIEKTPTEWKELLSDQEYYVIREKGTEGAFTGDLLKIKDDGVYICKACGLPLFASDTKFDSGTGWPSFYQPIDSKVIKEDTDYNLGYARTEVMCERCEGHLGHVFRDGPKPTGLRYCINSVSLDFKKK